MDRKKTSKDYDQFYFRITEDRKRDINIQIEEILEILKDKRSPEKKLPKRNALILKALTIGLDAIEKKLKK